MTQSFVYWVVMVVNEHDRGLSTTILETTETNKKQI